MIRNDYYAIFKDKEYRIDKLKNGEYELVSWNPIDQEIGFIRNSPTSSAYVKKTNKQEIEHVYSIHTFGIYKGKKYYVTTYETDTQYLLFSDASQESLDLGFTVTNKAESEKWVDKSEVTLFEEKTLKPNFFGEND